MHRPRHLRRHHPRQPIHRSSLIQHPSNPPPPPHAPRRSTATAPEPPRSPPPGIPIRHITRDHVTRVPSAANSSTTRPSGATPRRLVSTRCATHPTRQPPRHHHTQRTRTTRHQHRTPRHATAHPTAHPAHPRTHQPTADTPRTHAPPPDPHPDPQHPDQPSTHLRIHHRREVDQTTPTLRHLQRRHPTQTPHRRRQIRAHQPIRTTHRHRTPRHHPQRHPNPISQRLHHTTSPTDPPAPTPPRPRHPPAATPHPKRAASAADRSRSASSERSAPARTPAAPRCRRGRAPSATTSVQLVSARPADHQQPRTDELSLARHRRQRLPGHPVPPRSTAICSMRCRRHEDSAGTRPSTCPSNSSVGE